MRPPPGFVAKLPDQAGGTASVDEEDLQRRPGRMMDGREVSADRDRTLARVGDCDRPVPGLVLDLPDHVDGAPAGVPNALGQRDDKKLEGPSRRVVDGGGRGARRREATASQSVRRLPGLVETLPENPGSSPSIDEEDLQGLAGGMMDGRQVRTDGDRALFGVGDRDRSVPTFV